jgi:hypothetical protein
MSKIGNRLSLGYTLSRSCNQRVQVDASDPLGICKMPTTTIIDPWGWLHENKPWRGKKKWGRKDAIGSVREQREIDNWFTRQERDVFLVTKAKKWLYWLER